MRVLSFASVAVFAFAMVPVCAQGQSAPSVLMISVDGM